MGGWEKLMRMMVYHNTVSASGPLSLFADGRQKAWPDRAARGLERERGAAETREVEGPRVGDQGRVLLSLL